MLLIICGPSAKAADNQATFSAAVFYGATAIDNQQLAQSYHSVLGKPINEKLTSTIINNIRNLYTNNGFLPPAVNINPQDTNKNILIVVIQESQVGYLNVTPQSGKLAKKIQHTVSQYSFSTPIQQQQVKNLISALNKLSGITSSIRFEPRTNEPSTYDLYVDAQKTITGQLSISNEGSEVIGQDIASAQIHAYRPGNIPLNFGLYISGTTESSNHENKGGYITLPFANTFETFIGYSRSTVVLDRDSFILRTDYETDQWQLRFSHTPKTKTPTNVYVEYISRDYQRNNNFFTELDERLRLASLGIKINLIKDSFESSLHASITQGINDFGAERNELSISSTEEIDIDFTRANIDYSLWLALPLNMTARIDVAGQYSEDTLPTSQTFSIGGNEFARAYEPGEFIGDRGIGSKIEIRKTFHSFKDTLITPYIYYGIGSVTRKSLTKPRASGASTGIGLRIKAHSFSAFIEADQPLTSDSLYRDNQERITGRINYTF